MLHVIRAMSVISDPTKSVPASPTSEFGEESQDKSEVRKLPPCTMFPRLIQDIYVVSEGNVSVYSLFGIPTRGLPVSLSTRHTTSSHPYGPRESGKRTSRGRKSNLDYCGAQSSVSYVG